MTDKEFLEALGIERDLEEFSERVAIIVQDMEKPTEEQIDWAREQALACNESLGIMNK